jgi:hypothetical protein
MIDNKSTENKYFKYLNFFNNFFFNKFKYFPKKKNY